uniref:Uncharacterized protein n=1 Tax=Arundo donax TaxID=35708 RepID=A0A0A9D7S5_ARUDO
MNTNIQPLSFTKMVGDEFCPYNPITSKPTRPVLFTFFAGQPRSPSGTPQTRLSDRARRLLHRSWLAEDQLSSQIPITAPMYPWRLLYYALPKNKWLNNKTHCL